MAAISQRRLLVSVDGTESDDQSGLMVDELEGKQCPIQTTHSQEKR